MVNSKLTIKYPDGLHVRPASMFVREAAKFKSKITLTCDGTSVNGKSIMGLLMLALGPGSIVEISAEGPDEEAALQRLAEIISGNFDEK